MENPSYIQALNRAMDGTARVLFRPFDLGKWCVMGFSAWLAALGEGFSFTWWDGSDTQKLKAAPEAFSSILDAHAFIALLIGGLVLAIFTLAFVMAWLKARGQFVFLDNVVMNRPAVVEPWKKTRRQGWSLFWWSLLCALALLTLFCLIIACAVALVWTHLKSGEPLGRQQIAILVAFIPPILIWLVFTLYLWLFLHDFVTPIMYKHHLKTAAAWRRFLPLFRAHAATFLVYGLVRLLMSMVIATALFAAGCLTCCCGFLLMAIPYIGAVVTLPIPVFIRLYSLEFLRQFGADFDAFAQEPPPLPASPLTPSSL